MSNRSNYKGFMNFENGTVERFKFNAIKEDSDHEAEDDQDWN